MLLFATPFVVLGQIGMQIIFCFTKTLSTVSIGHLFPVAVVDFCFLDFVFSVVGFLRKLCLVASRCQPGGYQTTVPWHGSEGVDPFLGWPSFFDYDLNRSF